MNEKIVHKYYHKNIKRYKPNEPDPIFNPEKWITNSSEIDINFARYFQFLLNYKDNEVLTLKDVCKLTEYFNYYCLVNKEIILEEECKKNKPLSQLYLYAIFEIESLGTQNCNINRNVLDLTINCILNSNDFCLQYKNLNGCQWDYICVSDLIKNKSISDFLFQCLDNNCEVYKTIMIIDMINYQEDYRLYESIDKYLNPKFQSDNFVDQNIDIQRSAINYLMNVTIEESKNKLEKYVNNIYKENKIVFYVTHILKNEGEEGIIKLYQSTNDIDIKTEIINKYDFYRTKKYAQLLVNELCESSNNGNDNWALKEHAAYKLRTELFDNLIKWFGHEILDKI